MTQKQWVTTASACLVSFMACPVEGMAQESTAVEASASVDDCPAGLGIFGIFIPAHQGKLHWDSENLGEDDDSIKLKPVTGGFGFFGEYKIKGIFPVSMLPYLAVGAEMFFAFPKVTKIGGVDKPKCERNVFFAFNVRVRLPILVHRIVAPYPLFALGISNVTDRLENEDTDNYTGLDLTLGGGVEFYVVRYFFPFIELRYLFGAGWDKTEYPGSGKTKERIYYHAFLINLGIRFL